MRCRKKNFAIQYYVLKSMKEGRVPMQHKGSLGVGTTPDHCLDINRALLASMEPGFSCGQAGQSNFHCRCLGALQV